MITVHAINLPHRTDRRYSFEHQAEGQGFKVRFWDGIVSDTPSKSVNLAHKQIVRYAKEKKLPQITIAEDDCCFFAKGAFDYYIKKILKDYDIYFGMIYSGEIDESNRIIEGFSGNTLYMVHERFYDTFLSVPDTEHLDRFLGTLCSQYKFMVCPQFVCYQSNGYSDRAKAYCKYEPLLEGRKIFGK